MKNEIRFNSNGEYANKNFVYYRLDEIDNNEYRGVSLWR